MQPIAEKYLNFISVEKRGCYVPLIYRYKKSFRGKVRADRAGLSAPAYNGWRSAGTIIIMRQDDGGGS